MNTVKDTITPRLTMPYFFSYNLPSHEGLNSFQVEI